MPKTIYNHEKEYTKLYKSRISDNTALSKANKRFLIDFFDSLKAEGISYGRRLKYLHFLKNIMEWLNIDFDKAEKRDLLHLAGTIKEQDYTEQTKKDYLVCVKKLYKTLSILPEYSKLNPIYTWLYDRRNKAYSTNLDMSKIKTKEEWFDEADVDKILSATSNSRDKALLAIVSTQGTRPQELLTLRKKDIKPIDKGIVLKVAGKTGVRDIFVYEGFVIKTVNEYLKSLPESQEYLFEIGLARANNILKDICKKVGITKPANLYRLRKFAVTRDRVAGLSMQCLEMKYGWIKGSKVISHYDKSIGIDYQKEMQRRYGLIKDTPKSKFEDKLCVRCGNKNNFDLSHCENCALDLKTTREVLTLNSTRMEKDIKQLKTDMAKMIAVFEWLSKNEKLNKVVLAQAVD